MTNELTPAQQHTMNEMLKLATISKAAKALAEAAQACGVSIEMLIPMVTVFAQKEMI
jgi:hypothetical protein